MNKFLITNGFMSSGNAEDFFCVRRWGYFFASIVVAASFSKIVYSKLDLPQQYLELIVGSIAWSYSNKSHDYITLFSFVGGFFVSISIISWLSGRLRKTVGGEAEDGFHEFIVFLSTPVGLWFTGLLTTKNTSLLLVEISGLLILGALIFTSLLAYKKESFWCCDSTNIYSILQVIFLTIFVAGLAITAIGLSINRIAAMLNSDFWMNSKTVYRSVRITLVLVTITSGAIVVGSCRSNNLEQMLKKNILLFQVFCPAFFLVLIPTPWLVGNKIISGYSISPIAWIVIASCIIVAYIDLYSRFKAAKVPDNNPVNILSWICVAGAILFFKIEPTGLPSISSDDYHFGEMLTPWWSLAQQHMVPFWDYAPARGLINYSPGAAASLLFYGTVASFNAVWPFLYLGILFISFPVLSKSIGKGVATFAFLLAPYTNGLSEIDILVTAFICFLCSRFSISRPYSWIALYISLSLAMLLYAPGQGSLAIIAVSPLGCVMLYRLFSAQGRNCIKQLLFFILFIFLICLLTPLGRMIFGAVRYGLEQSSVNSIAHGITWSASFATNISGNPWLYELMRASLILVALWAGILIIKSIRGEVSMERNIRLGFAVPIFILVTLFIPRAAGRIDPGPSRLAYASIWSLSLLLPILLFSTSKNRYKGLLVFLWISLTGLVHPYFGGTYRNNPYPFYDARINPIYVDYFTLSAMTDTQRQFPAIGRAITDSAHLSRLREIRKVLDKVLRKGETYLDFTSRGAQYFYFDRKPPIESGAVYNLVTESQQIRAINSLMGLQPPAILIAADNINYDGGGTSLRSHLLYRYIMLNPHYKVVQVGKFVWLISYDRVDNLTGLDIKSVTPIDGSPDNLINRIFRVPDLRFIPASWGRSYKSLSRMFHKVNEVTGDHVEELNEVVRIGNSLFRPIGNDPFIRVDIWDLNLNGRDAGLVSFNFKCEGVIGEPIIELYWSSAMYPESELTVVRFVGKDGVLIVPLDSIPSWLLAKNIQSLRFDLSNKDSCKSFKIDNITLLQRNAVFKVPT